MQGRLRLLQPKLLGSKAAIQSGGYVVYQRIEQSDLLNVVTLYCMAYARRKFEAIKDSSPEARKVLSYIAVLPRLRDNMTTELLTAMPPYKVAEELRNKQ